MRNAYRMGPFLAVVLSISLALGAYAAAEAADAQAGSVEIAAQGGGSALVVHLGNGQELRIVLSGSRVLTLVKLSRLDINGDGLSDFVFIAREGSSGPYSVHAVSLQGDTLIPLAVLNPDGNASFRFSASFARDHILEIQNGSNTFLYSAKLDPAKVAGVYRADGSVPDGVSVNITSIRDFQSTTYAGGEALDVRQAVRYGSGDTLLGWVISTLVWRGQEVLLVGQRFEPA
jgi:hypothetical protein